MRPIPSIVTAGREGHGKGWEVIDSPPVPGACATNLRDRIMYAPCHPGDLEDAIRGHELIHAGFSPRQPVNELAEWFEVSPDNLRTAEEWRVNLIAWKAGIDVTILHDPADEGNAINLARGRDLPNALRLIVRTHGTNIHRKVLKRIRENAPKEWAKPIENLQRAIRQTKRNHSVENRGRNFASKWKTAPDGSWTRVEQLIPRGFLASLELARFLEWQQANDPTPTREQEAKNATAQQQRQQQAEQEELEDTQLRKFRKLPEHDLEGTGYESVRLADLDHELEHRGRLSKRRVPAQVGKNPRRIDRWHTDPARRVFDRKIRARGGVVLIDQSGSMSLERSQIDAILERAGGAIVIGYSNTGNHRANVWIHAQNGQRSSITPLGGSQNAVDGSALMFAISKRTSRRDPLLWVTDGRCYEQNGGIKDKTAQILEEVVKRHNVTTLDNTDDAIRELDRLARGNHPRVRLNPFLASRAKRWRTLRDEDRGGAD